MAIWIDSHFWVLPECVGRRPWFTINVCSSSGRARADGQWFHVMSFGCHTEKTRGGCALVRGWVSRKWVAEMPLLPNKYLGVQKDFCLLNSNAALCCAADVVK